MKWIKYSLLFLMSLIIALLLIFAVEYDFGMKKTKNHNCEIGSGYEEAYVHWLIPMNHSISMFCNGDTTPKFSLSSKKNKKCECN